MALIALPPAWISDVRKVLETDDVGGAILWTWSGLQRFKESAGPESTEHDGQQAFLDTLAGSRLCGCPVEMDRPDGETYEFYVSFEGSRFYGKILLETDRRSIVIFSLHQPPKPKLRCE